MQAYVLLQPGIPLQGIAAKTMEGIFDILVPMVIIGLYLLMAAIWSAYLLCTLIKAVLSLLRTIALLHPVCPSAA